MYKNVRIEGECSEWQYFVQYGFDLPVDTIQIGTITMTIGTVDPDASPDAASESSLTATCDDKDSVDALVSGLQTGEIGRAHV